MKSLRVVLFFLLAVLPAAAQINNGDRTRCTIRVDVVYRNGHRAPARLQVQLLQAMNDFPIAMGVTNSSGNAEFANLAPGQYHVKVSGNGIKTADSGLIQVDDWNVFLSKTVVVQNTATAQADADAHSGGAVVSVADLNVPKRAVEEYNRGNQEMAKKHWDKAIDHLNKAIKIHPKFAAAYNNLAVCYSQKGQKDRQREALQEAVSADDHCVPALLNLARLKIADKQVAEAGDLLTKAVTADPTNVGALSLLAEIHVKQGHYQQAIEEAQKVHSLPHQHFAIVHYTAANAYEHEGLFPEAIAELRVYLQEEPKGRRADFVRKVLPQLEKQAQEAQARSSR
jgi:tetratricopeptide (TPR) repeat protein